MKKSAVAGASLGLLALALLGAWTLGLRPSAQRPPAPGPDLAAGPAAGQRPAVAVPTNPASAPGVGQASDAAITPDSAPPTAASRSVEAVLTGLFGHASVLALFQLDDFPRRVAATVDNLGREHAASRLWPVNPAEGRFLTDKRGNAEVISADNGLRYMPYVLLIETVDLHQIAAAYAELYPRFQKAYEDLGFPGRRFGDRVLEVLDQLAATPTIDDPIKVRLPTIHGPIQPPRPWVLYEYEDPALQSLTAGQRLLLRTGPVNERRLKAKLAELRRLLVSGAPRQ